ncbi:hypothetical protein [Tissierella sp.]|uniref:hypothetical protein n=1 Tax=Tissierella sp. TaxID=41274 RepID=UPI002855C143|nr:hypothetical protein [Tissierella sp.]MDR7855080.1 hypothetical protein [Tissierella sp.]
MEAYIIREGMNFFDYEKSLMNQSCENHGGNCCASGHCCQRGGGGGGTDPSLLH